MTAKPRTPRPPVGLAAAGRKLWADVAGSFGLDEHELALLREACRTVDQLEQLDQLVRDQGVVIDGQRGPKMNPALAEARQQRIALARLVAVLRLPAGLEGEDEAVGRRQPRRVGVRGTYGIRGAV